MSQAFEVSRPEGERLAQLRGLGRFHAIDLQLAAYLAGLARAGQGEVALAAALVSSWVQEGHVCLNLPTLAGDRLTGGEGAPAVPLPALEDWRAALRDSGVVGAPGDYHPLILDHDDRLYLYRYWDLERRLAALMRARAAAAMAVDARRLRSVLDRLFPPAETHQDIDWQKIAAAVAVSRQLCVVSGGPGTGKTTTVMRILAALLSLPDGADQRIALLAPTGKAAARMQDALNRERAKLDLAPEQLAAIPDRADTVHRFLGLHAADRTQPRYHPGNPAPVDVVVLDEASMVDLGLMTRLLEALGPATRLVILGDKDQLASVEAGSVLGDLCSGFLGPTAAFAAEMEHKTGITLPEHAASASPLQDAIVLLQRNYRFGDASALGDLAKQINGGEAEAAWKTLQDTSTPAVRLEDAASPLEPWFSAQIEGGFEGYFQAVTEARPADEILTCFDQFRVLCVHRVGPVGVAAINRRIEQALARAGMINPARVWYAGRPVMITRNDHNLRLYNGDVGVTLRGADGQLRVYFSRGPAGVVAFAPARLPSHETVYAMTVHKTQGSEFHQVLLLLPDGPSPLLCRELIYTAVTRAREAAVIRAGHTAWRQAIARRVQRSTGLSQQLWSETASS